MNIISKSSKILVAASEGSPIITTLVVILFYAMFNQVLAMLEILIFGERFKHWLDPVFATCFMAYAAYAVYECASYNAKS